MFESSRSYTLKIDRIITPMFHGKNSGKALKISYALARNYKSELTATTVRTRTEGYDVLGRLNLVTSIYNDGKRDGIKVIPKIVTFDNVKTGLISETSGHYYDIIVISTEKRSVLSSSIFGSIGDYILKNVSIPAAIVSTSTVEYPYKKILLPLSESLNIRPSVMFAYRLAKITGAELAILDLRKYDQKPLHGFKLIFDNPGDFFNSNNKINFVKSGDQKGIKEEVDSYIHAWGPDCIVLGLKSVLRINSDLKYLIKYPGIDTVLIKK
ncbi:MAG: universal stress protein [Ferroplasma sp.]